MTKQIACPTFEDFCGAQDEVTNHLLLLQSIVIWAGEQTEPGEWVGGIGEQNQRAARNLQLHVAVIERARAMRGVEALPMVWEAYQKFLGRLAATPPPRQQSVYAAQLIPFETMRQVIAPREPVPRLRQRGLRKVG